MVNVPPNLISSIVEEDLKHLLQHSGEELLDTIQSKTPVNSGKLRNAWKIDHNENGFEINNETSYAGYVEEGSIHNRPVGMVSTSLIEIDQILKNNTRNL